MVLGVVVVCRWQCTWLRLVGDSVDTPSGRRKGCFPATVASHAQRSRLHQPPTPPAHGTTMTALPTTTTTQRAAAATTMVQPQRQRRQDSNNNNNHDAINIDGDDTMARWAQT